MRTLLTSICLMACLSSSAQALLGYSYMDISETLDDRDVKIGNTEDDNTLYMSYSSTNNQHVYYFDKDKVCYMYVMSPLTQVSLNAGVEFYNKNYVIMSDTHWMMYTSGGTCDIHLIRDGKLTYFLWKIL